MPNWREILVRGGEFLDVAKTLKRFQEAIQRWWLKRKSPPQKGTMISVDTAHASITIQLSSEKPNVSINLQEGKTVEIKTGSGPKQDGVRQKVGIQK